MNLNNNYQVKIEDNHIQIRESKKGRKFHDFDWVIAAYKMNPQNIYIKYIDNFLKESYEILSKIDKFNNLLLFLLREIIIALKETGRIFYSDPNLLNKLIRLYWNKTKDFEELINETHLEKIKFKYTYIDKEKRDFTLKFSLYLDAAEHYLDLCMNDDNQDWFDLHSDDLNREQEVEKIANFLIDLKQNGKYGGYEKLDLLIQKARIWIMLRYDIDKAAYYQFHNHPFWLNVFKVLPEVCGFIILFALLTINSNFWLSISSPVIQISDKLKIDNYGLLSLYAIFIIEGFILVNKIKAGKVQTQVFMPRIAGGIIVGYLALLAEEMWIGIFSSSTPLFDLNYINWLHFSARILIPLVVIYIYLLVEMSNVKGIEDIQKKAGRILVRGYSYSLMIGAIFCDIFGESLVKLVGEWVWQSDPKFTFLYFKGVFGNIYPEPILILSPLALFIGVFLQLLWEDKAVTEKI